MLQHFLEKVNPDSSTNRLRTLNKFSNLSFPSAMSGQEFLSIGRGLAQNMKNLDSEELVVMKMITVFQEDGRFPKIVDKWIAGDLVGCNLDRLSDEMDLEEDRTDLVSGDTAPPPLPSAIPGAKFGTHFSKFNNQT